MKPFVIFVCVFWGFWGVFCYILLSVDSLMRSDAIWWMNENCHVFKNLFTHSVVSNMQIVWL